jgi:hypothetical protein
MNLPAPHFAIPACLQATAGSLQSLCWASSAVGGIASAYFSGSLVQDYGSHTVFAVTAIFPLIVSASALLIDEQRVSQTPAAAPAGAGSSKTSKGLLPAVSSSSGSSLTVRQRATQVLGESVVAQGLALWGAVKQRNILLPTVFVFLWQVSTAEQGPGAWLSCTLTACNFCSSENCTLLSAGDCLCILMAGECGCKQPNGLDPHVFIMVVICNTSVVTVSQLLVLLLRFALCHRTLLGCFHVLR